MPFAKNLSKLIRACKTMACQNWGVILHEIIYADMMFEE